MKNKFYITTPIYYVNDRPHIGHAYTTIAADVSARYHRTKGEDVIFLTGTDENSQKTVEGAKKSGEDVKTYADRLAAIWKSTWEALNIGNTDFIRTTEERHVKTVQEIWKRIWDNGDIYKGKYEGLYCKGHEAFMKEVDLVDGVCSDHKTKPEWIAEDNYFFKLKKYEKDLLKLYGDNPNFVTPEGRFHEVKSFVERGLEDISISREKQEWGIPVPNDNKHVIYVWFDALINYISAIGIDGWQKHPADVHAIGKDIIRFHAVIWPAMLMSAKLPLPKRIVTNGFFTIDGVKISKSLGNAIDPLDLAKKYGVDALRYFLLREIPYGEDGDFSEVKLKERYNADLANGLGNLVARVATLGEKVSPIKYNYTHPLHKLLKEAHEEYDYKISTFRFDEALEIGWKRIAQSDAALSVDQPWYKEGSERAEKILSRCIELVIITDLLEPFLPETAQKIKDQISYDRTNKVFHIKKTENLFPRK
ncbi:MAG: methionine--tRNA ligase [Candidatus Liptonbacteria bacterium]|nr:methionine--tRNA ligase [Candidatus Liptonbacteria bacterium]